MMDTDQQPQRLQKVLAAAGLGSRRDCEDLIREGRVEVDRQVVTELGTRVDPSRQEIRVDGETLRQPKQLYFAVNKPVGVVTTNRDPSGRARVIDLVPTDERVFAVGRLDRSSEGLILVTNDGEFANRITHPRYGVEKTYLVRVAGEANHKQLERLKRGVHLAEGFARAASIAVKKKHGQSTDLAIVLNEGRNREIRRILARVGHKVLTLKRVAVGPIKLGDLPSGGWRRLMPQEVEALLRVAKEKRRAAKGKGRPASGGRGAAGIRGQEAGVRSQESGEQYIQKQALLAQPLSLEDLLRDDLDEGPLTPADLAESGGEESAGTPRGDVIDYEAEPTSPPAERKPDRDKRHKGRHGPNKFERRPREDFGRKRGGKRAFGPPQEGRGAGGETTGSFRFRKKKKHKKSHVHGSQQEGRRGGGRGKKKQFGKPGGKRKGRR
jgi:23S rRNA pseudouridine2605 synthase